jgi:hypothetical protein
MDLSVWSSKPFELPAQLPDPRSWQLDVKEWCLEGVGWRISVMPTERSKLDTPESAVLQRLPDASHVAYVTLEPIGADDMGYRFLEKVVRGLARATSGVWVDPSGSAYCHDEGDFGNP